MRPLYLQRIVLCAFLGFFFCCAIAAQALIGERQLIEIHRMVTIGDVHGDAENFLKILRVAGLVEDFDTKSLNFITNPPKWRFSPSANESIVVHTTLLQMGDLVDRGEQDLESLNIAIALQEQTQQSSTMDKVVLLMGNHELLNLQGYYHYVNKRNYGGFRSKPLRVEAMNPDGAFGKYIIDNFKVAHLEEDTLFVHAGLETEAGLVDVDSLNAEVRQAIEQRDFRHRYLRSNGPLWTRKMIQDSMIDKCSEVGEILDNYHAARIVVGHTPQHSGRIEQYCDGRVIAADVGMSRWMYDKVAAVEMVFLKYINPDNQQTSTTVTIRQLREGSEPFSVPGVVLRYAKSGFDNQDSVLVRDEDDNDDL